MTSERLCWLISRLFDNSPNVKFEFLQTDSVSNNIINSKVIRVPKCYPVYETGYQENLNVIIDYLKSIENLLPIGRYGSFKYNNQDHSIFMGLMAAEKKTKNSSIDLWAINTDTEYQEEGEIKDVLVY